MAHAQLLSRKTVASFARYFLLFSFVFTSSVLSAQVTITGRVMDEEDGVPLIGARITVPAHQVGVQSDEQGNFDLKVPQSPPFEMIITYFGYDTTTVKVTNANIKQRIRIDLVESKFSVEEVEITASAAIERQKQAALTVESMSLSAIKETPASSFYEGLGNLKGVDLTSASLGFKVINTRGFNSTSPVRSLQIIDGVDNQSPGLNFSLGNFLGASELDVESVDLIVGASSAFYGPNAFNGVISMNTKNPFIHRGLSASIKVGERNMAEGAIRYAKVFQDKKGKDRFAFKLNAFYLRADDWEANNMSEAYRDTLGVGSIQYVGTDNPGGYDAVNRYGDESFSRAIGSELVTKPGLEAFYRTGYNERDVVNYDTRNFKSSVALHYKIKDDVEVIASSAFSSGTTVFQGENRISLQDITFFQHRIEIQKPNKFFVRAYMTHENGGNSYDAVFTAFRLQEQQKSDGNWYRDYNTAYGTTLRIQDSVRMIEGFPSAPTAPPFLYDFAKADSVLAANNGDVTRWHNGVRAIADDRYLAPGTEGFNTLFNDITSRAVNDGGTRFIDRSALYHLHGEYRFKPSWAEIVTGGNMRLYTPVSDGTIFLDTAGAAITNLEYGLYAGIEKKLVNNTVKLNATLRTDRNQNFQQLFSPAASVVWNVNENHILRASTSFAVRNPTLSDQYLFYNVGRAILLGNINGIDDLITLESFNIYTDGLTFNFDTLDFFSLDPIRPEKVQTFEVGYRGTMGHLYVDAGYYFSRYTDFIGYQLGLDVEFAGGSGGIPTSVIAYRVASNAKDVVTTQGFSIGLNYFLDNGITFNGNYSWNVLNTQTDDPIIPAFNTPEHKFNLGVTGRDISIGKLKHIGFSVNYKWIEGFLFEGSPQFTGFINSYNQLDAQINRRFNRINSTIKLGASNVLNNKVYQVYGGPLIGRLAYLSWTFDFKKN